METLRVYLFKDSFGSFVDLLNEHQVRYRLSEVRSVEPMASAGFIEVLQSAAMWGGLAAVIVAFINRRRGRKVIISTKENTVVHAEGLSLEELEQVLRHAKHCNRPE